MLRNNMCEIALKKHIYIFCATSYSLLKLIACLATNDLRCLYSHI